jgi:peptide/nickel transport system substrate-binding protein
MFDGASVPAGQATSLPLEDGEVDYLGGVGGISAEDAKRLSSSGKFRVAFEASEFNYLFLSMNVQNPKLKDIRIREAIRHAIDVPSMLAVTSQAASTRMNALIAKGMVGYWADAPVYHRDVQKAKSLIAAAGANGLELNLTPVNAGLAAVQVIQANLADIGLKVQIVQNPPVSPLNDKHNDMSLNGYGGAPDPYYQFEWFTTGQIGLANPAFWSNKAFDRLEVVLGAQPDPAKRAKIAIEMQKLMDASAAFVFFEKWGVWNGWVSSKLRPVYLAGWPMPRLFRPGS